MQFQVPQFTEYETKFVGPLTLKQFFAFGIAAGAVFILYFILPFQIFLTISIGIVILTTLLVFWKINGQPLLITVKNFLTFSASSKLYLWKRKRTFIAFKPLGKETAPIETEEELPLKIAEKSKLKKLRSHIETGL